MLCRDSQPWHIWHSEPDNSVLWETVLHCDIFSSTSGLYPLDTSGTIYLWQIKISTDIAKCPLGSKWPPGKKYCIVRVHISYTFSDSPSGPWAWSMYFGLCFQAWWCIWIHPPILLSVLLWTHSLLGEGLRKQLVTITHRTTLAACWGWGWGTGCWDWLYAQHPGAPSILLLSPRLQLGWTHRVSEGAPLL